MVTASQIRFHDLQFQATAPTGIWRWTTRMDVSGSAPSFEIRDIRAPFGVLRDTIPIPGTIVAEMADSIEAFKTYFPPRILLGPPPSLTFVVDEGRGFSAPQEVALSNNGVFGSLLSATLSTSAAYVTVDPTTVGNLSSGEVGSFEVAVDSTDLLVSQSPLAETVTVQDASATNNPQTYNISITIRPKATIDTDPDLLIFSAIKPLTGPFDPVAPQIFTIENTGPVGSVLEFQVQRLTGLSEDWLDSFTPIMGTLNSGQTQDITVTVAPIEGLPLGEYTETLRISGYSTNSHVDVTIELNIT